MKAASAPPPAAAALPAAAGRRRGLRLGFGLGDGRERRELGHLPCRHLEALGAADFAVVEQFL